MAILAPPDRVRPDYHIYKYTDSRYKIVRFKSTEERLAPYIPDPDVVGYKHDKKLSQAFSRARRMCLAYALCNDWKWFCTFTVAKNNYDRKNLDGYYSRFTQWLRDRRKRTGKKYPYLLVPEQHGDGSWHLHGFFNSDIDDELISFADMDAAGYRSENGKRLPLKLINGGYMNWSDYQEKFGFCSFGKIRNRDATAFYCVKYISKSFSGDAGRVGLSLYYASRGLNNSTYFDSVYGPCSELDRCLQNHYEFCSTGFYVFSKQPGDNPLLDILEDQHNSLYPITFDLADDPDLAAEIDNYYEITQLAMMGFEG